MALVTVAQRFEKVTSREKEFDFKMLPFFRTTLQTAFRSTLRTTLLRLIGCASKLEATELKEPNHPTALFVENSEKRYH